VRQIKLAERAPRHRQHGDRNPDETLSVGAVHKRWLWHG